MDIEKSNSSFRDPDGFIFHYNEQVYRKITPEGLSSYLSLMKSGLYSKLTQDQLLIPHKEVQLEGIDQSDGTLILKPEKINIISYPYEWSFSQLKDAALHTLSVQKEALHHNISLKDASAYNIQFRSGRTVFIDTLSFEQYTPGPWKAYKQFCQHFLAPLCLSSYIDHSLTKLMINYIDGIPINIASKLLPKKSYFSLGILLNIHAHARYQIKYSNQTLEITPKTQANISKEKALASIELLQATIKKLKNTQVSSEWSNYYQNTNYSLSSMDEKKQFVASKIKKSKPHQIVDLGANNGEFSRLAAKFCNNIISLDIDALAVEYNYKQCKRDSITAITPLIQDLTNPSPGIGWDNTERLPITQRCNGDIALALALIHHLAISNNLPLENIAIFLSKIAPCLIIEFVPKTDSQVMHLLQTREDIFPDYTEKGFEEAFKKHFNITEKKYISNSERTLYEMKRLLPSKNHSKEVVS